MPTTYDDVSGDEPFRTKAERALHGEGEKKMPMEKDADGMPVYRMPEFDGEKDKASRKLGTGDQVDKLKAIPEELLDDSVVEIPSDIEERLEDIRKRVEELLTTHPRAMALKLAIEALPGVAPEQQIERAQSYILFIKGE